MQTLQQKSERWKSNPGIYRGGETGRIGNRGKKESGNRIVTENSHREKFRIQVHPNFEKEEYKQAVDG